MNLIRNPKLNNNDPLLENKLCGSNLCLSSMCIKNNTIGFTVLDQNTRGILSICAQGEDFLDWLGMTLSMTTFSIENCA